MAMAYIGHKDETYSNSLHSASYARTNFPCLGCPLPLDAVFERASLGWLCPLVT